MTAAPASAHADPLRSAAWRDAERVLCVRLDNLGDVLMTTPALRALKSASPARHLTLLTSRSGAELAPYVPEIDTIITYDAPWMKQPSEAAAEACDGLIDRLYGGGYDAAVIFTVYSQSALPAALVCWLARIPLRLAYCRENPYQLLTDWTHDPEPHLLVRHEVQRQLDLVATVGCRTLDERLSFHPRPEDEAKTAAKLRAAGIDLEAPWIVVHPGASAPSRRYPAESFGAAVAALGEACAHQVLVTGSHDEVALTRAIVAALPRRAFSLAGVLGLGELGLVLQHAELLISNNTGPVHIAAAVGTPVVDLYALTNPQHAPWQVASRVLYHDVPCRFCYRSVCAQAHHDCLRLVSPERVAQAALELLARHDAVAAVATGQEIA